MKKVVIVGGGWAGCAAAVAARKAGAEVFLLERTDSLLGTGLVGGIMRNNGRFTAAEEMIAMGCGDLVTIADRCARHRNIRFPGHDHATLYNVGIIEPVVKGYLEALGVDVRFGARVTSVKKAGERLEACVTASGEEFPGDAFVDATGSAGPQANCVKFGNGCCMCILRCPSFGGRVSLTALCGVQEWIGKAASGKPGSMSGSCKLLKESLAPEIVQELDANGVCVIPIPEELGKKDVAFKACQQYALQEYRENIVLLDTGHAKLMASYFPLESLRKIPGMEFARFEDPYAGGKGNSIRYMAIAPRDDALKVDGMDNLFCGGEKAGTLVGHTEAMVTGSLAGLNAVRFAEGQIPVVLPETLACGDIIARCNRDMRQGAGLSTKYTFSGSVYFNHMKEAGLYTSDPDVAHKRVKEAGLDELFGTDQFLKECAATILPQERR
ncbi:MAG TPA: FAD-dependent oxidoreductase [Firmicutes bacterium]|nr:FAD-dependent oxidoreductase [Candidatus Fermentithermobacillaceae bacterium]